MDFRIGNTHMALVLTEEQSMLRDSARGLISDKAPVSHLRHLRDSKDSTGFSKELWHSFAEMGFAGLLVPEEFGGSGLGHVEAGVVMEEIGRTLMPSPFLATSVVAASALNRGGNSAQRSEYLPKIASGSLLATLAIDEGAKHRPLHTGLQAVRAGNGFKLSGAKALVVDGHVADLLIVAARTTGAAGEREGLTLFLVNPAAKGVAIERTIMVDAHNAARIEFANVEVNADSVLGEVDQGATLLEGVLDIGRGAVAAEMVGLSEEVFGRTVEYLKSRKQFGNADRRIPGPPAPRRRALCRHRDRPRRGDEGAAGPGWRRRQGRLCRRSRKGPRRHHGHARGAGRRADAWRHGHDRPVRHRLLHEARAGVRGIVRRCELSHRATRKSARVLRRGWGARARLTLGVVARLDRATQYAAASPHAFAVSGILDRPLSRAMTVESVESGGPKLTATAERPPTASAVRTARRLRSIAGSCRGGSSAWTSRRCFGRTSRRNCRRGG
ncbi:alkylation response protein AidB-like acyl-CoA dehydrogenase [Bradyrhizobium liaoningense]